MAILDLVIVINSCTKHSNHFQVAQNCRCFHWHILYMCVYLHGIHGDCWGSSPSDSLVAPMWSYASRKWARIPPVEQTPPGKGPASSTSLRCLDSAWHLVASGVPGGINRLFHPSAQISTLNLFESKMNCMVKSNFAERTIIVWLLCISGRYLIWCTFNFFVGSSKIMWSII